MPCGLRAFRHFVPVLFLASFPLVGFTDCRPEPYVGAIPIATGLTMPVFVAAPDGDPRLFVAEKTGRVKVIDPVARTVVGTFLDISNLVGVGGDRGLTSIAFPSDYPETGHFYVLYHRPNLTTLSRFVAADPAGNTADPATEFRLMSIQLGSPTYLGGGLRFGPDGMLYIGIGDSRADPGPGDSQHLRMYRGKILRIDVSGGPQDLYRIPPGNPFRAPAALPEIWAYGVHDPMRIDFDPDTGDLLVTDRGLDLRDEVDALPAGVGGQNLGWPAQEGDACARVLPSLPCEDPDAPVNLTFPIHDMPYGKSCRVVGGYAYAAGQAELRGAFAFSDACSNRLVLLPPAETTHPMLPADVTIVVRGSDPPITGITAIASDGFGEPHVVSGGEGVVYRIQVGYDSDDDGIAEPADNCPFVSNRDQSDWNGDGIGDACEDVGT
jgi:hypothetical protein